MFDWIGLHRRCRQPSHVLLAMGADAASARGSLRLSLGHTSVDADVDAALGCCPRRWTGPGGRAGGAGLCVSASVLAAMSGGVDSSVAAARMVDAGHDVVGVHLALSSAPGTLRTGSRGCCSKEDAGDARRVADVLGIPFYVWDFAERFKEDVIDDFVVVLRARGDTQSVRALQPARSSSRRCRRARWRWASTRWPPGTTRGCPTAGCVAPSIADKDQSYVLAVLTAEQLRHAAFPIGDTPKPQIRAEAAGRGLAVADKPDSHDICFIPSGDTQAFLGERIGVRRGSCGRRRRARCSPSTTACTASPSGSARAWASPARGADGRPRYVTAIDADTGDRACGRRGRSRRAWR